MSLGATTPAVQPAVAASPETRPAPPSAGLLEGDPAFVALRRSFLVAIGRQPASSLHLEEGMLVADARPATAARETAESAIRSLVDGMLARGGSPPPTDEVRGRVQESLATLPLSVVRAIDRAGTAIRVLRPGETPLEAGLIAPLRPRRDFSAASLRSHFQRAVQDADRVFGADLAEVRKELEAPEDPSRPPFLRQIEKVRLADRVRKLETWHHRHVMEAAARTSAGRLHPLQVPREQARGAVTADDVARLHGATTEDEVRQFVSLFTAINGKRLVAAQEALSPAADQPAADRPFRSDARLVVPNLYYFRPTAGGDAIPLNRHDRDSEELWRKGGVLGQFLPNARPGTVCLRADQLGDNVFGHSTPVHEMGHAYEHAVEILAPARWPGLRDERERTWIRLLTAGGSGFPSEYASVSPKEMVAESFAEALGARPSRLAELDPEWSASFDRFLAVADDLAAERPSWVRRWLTAPIPLKRFTDPRPGNTP